MKYPEDKINTNSDIDELFVAVNELLDEMIKQKEKRLLKKARQIIPYLTDEDIMQPQDHPQLYQDPIFQYEDGQIAGIRTAQIAIRTRILNKIRPPKQ